MKDCTGRRINHCSQCRHITGIIMGCNEYWSCSELGILINPINVCERIHPDCPLPDAQEGEI